MIELRVVGSSDDDSFLLFSDRPKGRRGTHAVPIDRDLLEILQAAVYSRRDRARQGRLDDAPDSSPTALDAPKVPPREIQRLLRAGWSVDRVADVLDCDVELVERFETPILYERNGVIGDVQRLFVEKARLGASGLNIRDSIETNLASRRIRLSEREYLEGWDATREEGQPWRLTYTFDFRGKQTARFDFDPRTGRVEPTNKAALDLAWVPEGTLKPNIPPPMPGGKRPARKPAARKTARKTAARKPARKTAARKPARKATARKTARKPARKSAARKPAARKPAARKTSARQSVARKSTSRKPARKAPARKSAARKSSARKPARRVAAARATSRRRSARR